MNKGAEKPWFVYLLLCNDNSIYIGITNNLSKRLLSHNSRKSGAKYTRSRQPVKLFKHFEVPDKSMALKIEHRLKKLSRREKMALSDIELLKKEFAVPRKYGLGIINLSHNHLDIAQSPMIKMVCSPEPSNQLNPDVKYFNDWENAIYYSHNKLDGIILIAEKEENFLVTKSALEKFIPIFIYNPTFLNKKEPIKLKEISETNKTKFFSNYECLFSRSFASMLSRLESKKIISIESNSNSLMSHIAMSLFIMKTIPEIEYCQERIGQSVRSYNAILNYGNVKHNLYADPSSEKYFEIKAIDENEQEETIRYEQDLSKDLSIEQDIMERFIKLLADDVEDDKRANPNLVIRVLSLMDKIKQKLAGVDIYLV